MGEEVSMPKTICKAVKTGEVSRRGKASVEWHDKDGNPKHYCLGYADQMTDELLSVCRECIDHGSRADDDLKAYWARR